MGGSRTLCRRRRACRALAAPFAGLPFRGVLLDVCRDFSFFCCSPLRSSRWPLVFPRGAFHNRFPSADQVAWLRSLWPAGSRVELVSRPIPILASWFPACRWFGFFVDDSGTRKTCVLGPAARRSAWFRALDSFKPEPGPFSGYPAAGFPGCAGPGPPPVGGLY